MKTMTLAALTAEFPAVVDAARKTHVMPAALARTVSGRSELSERRQRMAANGWEGLYSSALRLLGGRDAQK